MLWNTEDEDEVTWTVVTQLGTAGGVEEAPTFNRFSTPFSAPLKTVSVQLQYLNPDTGLQTGLVPIGIATDGTATIGDRVDVGLPGGLPGRRDTDRSQSDLCGALVPSGRFRVREHAGRGGQPPGRATATGRRRP